MDGESKELVPTPIEEAPRKGRRKKKEEPKEGLALKKWGLFFFVLSCISVALVAASLALPFFIAIFGIVSVIAWLAVVAVISIFTIGLVWTIDEVKTMNSNWMAFNNWLFNSTEAVANTAAKAIPILSIVGGVILLVTWLFVILGIATDKNRKKYYRGLIIALGVLTLAFIAIAIISIIINSNVQSTIGSSSSIH